MYITEFPWAGLCGFSTFALFLGLSIINGSLGYRLPEAWVETDLLTVVKQIMEEETLHKQLT